MQKFIFRHQFLRSKRKLKKKRRFILPIQVIVFFFRKTFLRKLFPQNIFWIDCGCGKHKKNFLEVERGRERKKFRQESEWFDQVQNWWSSSLYALYLFFCSLFFCQPNSTLGLRPRFTRIKE